MDSESKGTEPFAVASPMRDIEMEKAAHRRSRKKTCLCCCGVTTAIVVVVVVILIILGFTVFKPKDPELTVESVSLDSINIDLAGLLTNLNPSLEISLKTQVNVKNPNYASFKYKNTTAYLFYRGSDIGESALAAGKIKSRSSVDLTVPVDVRLSGQVVTSNLANLTSDLGTGVIPITTKVEIRGTASFLNIIKLKNARSTSVCELEIFVSNATLKDINCKNKLKI